jgi:phosphatidylglycerol:prolipoprotein diacylglycerol transferase
VVGSTPSVYCVCPYLLFFDSIPFFSYRLILALGLVLATGVALLRASRRGFSAQQAFDVVLSAAIGGVLVGRVAYVTANWVYFRAHPVEAVQPWRGGLVASGVVVGAVMGVLLLCRLRRIDPRPLLDVLAPAAAMVVVFAWLACLARGCSWGIEVWPDQGFLWRLRLELADLYGLRAPRFPVQLLGAAWSAALAAWLLLQSRPRRLFPIWLFLHALGDFVLGFLRGDVTALFAGLAHNQLADLGLALVGLILIITWARTKADKG